MTRKSGGSEANNKDNSVFELFSGGRIGKTTNVKTYDGPVVMGKDEKKLNRF